MAAGPVVLRFLYTKLGDDGHTLFRVEMTFRTVFGNIRLDAADEAYLENYEHIDEASIIGVCRGGIVMAGTDTTTGERRCVKIINLNIVRREDLVVNQGERKLEGEVLNEVQVNNKLRDELALNLAAHAGAGNIARCHNITQDNELQNLVFVQDLCDQGDLYDFVNARAQAGQPLTLPELEQLKGQLCAGLACMHAAGVAHLDISLENVMLAAHPNPGALAPGMLPFVVKLIDFGQSRVMQPIGAALSMPIGFWSCGKPTAISPEVADIQYGLRPPGAPPAMTPNQHVPGVTMTIQPFPADVWSVGCILYVLAYFTHPYNAIRDSGFDAIVAGQFPANPAYPPAFHTLLSAIFRNDPAQRPTAQQL